MSQCIDINIGVLQCYIIFNSSFNIYSNIQNLIFKYRLCAYTRVHCTRLLVYYNTCVPRVYLTCYVTKCVVQNTKSRTKHKISHKTQNLVHNTDPSHSLISSKRSSVPVPETVPECITVLDCPLSEAPELMATCKETLLTSPTLALK